MSTVIQTLAAGHDRAFLAMTIRHPGHGGERIWKQSSFTAETRRIRGGARRVELLLPSLAGRTQASASRVVCQCRATAPRSRHRFTIGHPALAWVRPANDGPGRAGHWFNAARSLDALPGPPAAATKAPPCRLLCAPPLPLRGSAVKGTVHPAFSHCLSHRAGGFSMLWPIVES